MKNLSCWLVFRNSLMLVLAVVTTGCAHSPYVVGNGEPTAKIVLIKPSEAAVAVSAISTRNCPLAEYKTIKRFDDESVSAMVSALKGEEFAARIHVAEIEAGRRFGISAMTGVCDISVVFTPVAGEKYELTHDATHLQCGLKVIHVAKRDDGTVVREPERSVAQVWRPRDAEAFCYK